MATAIHHRLMSSFPQLKGSCCKPKKPTPTPLMCMQPHPTKLESIRELETKRRKGKQLLAGAHGVVEAATTRRMPPEKLEVFESLEGWAEQNLLPLLRPVEASWQPQDFLPDPEEEEGFLEGVRELRERARGLPDEFYVCLVGDMVTEEALPTYQSLFNTFDGVKDDTGCSPVAWAVWTRAWAAEENRHGDLLNRYLYLCGRVDMRQVETTVQYLIGSGMVLPVNSNPYMGFVYTSFQERATFISHANTARQAKQLGDVALAKICGTIAADEKRHETAYTRVVAKLFEVDPDATMLAFAAMMRERVTMPAHFMYDGHDGNLFDNYSAVAQRTGVYTAKDYADIIEFLVKAWGVEHVTDRLSGQGREAQDYLCTLAPRIRKVEERAQQRAKQASTMLPFSWLFNRDVLV